MEPRYELEITYWDENMDTKHANLRKVSHLLHPPEFKPPAKCTEAQAELLKEEHEAYLATIPTDGATHVEASIRLGKCHTYRKYGNLRELKDEVWNILERTDRKEA